LGLFGFERHIILHTFAPSKDKNINNIFNFKRYEKEDFFQEGESEATSKSDQSGPELRAASRRYSNKSNGVPEEKG
jgi:hypothetical protein